VVIVLLAIAAAAALRSRRASAPTSTAPAPGEPEFAPFTATAAPPEAAPPVDEPAADPVVGPGAAWVAPVDGECPAGYPVKVAASGIFHVPGGRSYDRTKPDRCYPDPASAIADGYRQAKA